MNYEDMVIRDAMRDLMAEYEDLRKRYLKRHGSGSAAAFDEWFEANLNPHKK